MTNLCLECEYWHQDKKSCSYDSCISCKYDPSACDGVCNPPECKYGYDAMPEVWNPDYKWDR